MPSALSGEGKFVVVASQFGGGVVDDEVGAGDVKGAGVEEVSGAVAEVGQLQVGVAGKRKSGSEQHGVDFDAGGAGKLEVELGGRVGLGLASMCRAGEHPSSAGEEGSGEDADQSLGLVGADGGQVEAPFLGRAFEA